MSAVTSGLRSARVRRGVAAAAVILATGGLVLAREPRGGGAGGKPPLVTAPIAIPSGVNAVTFAGPGAHGQIALSHTKVLARAGEPVFAEVRVVADASDGAHARAPLSLAVVLDTSGSMDGDKIERAKASVLELIGDMRDDDEIAFVRYSSGAELIQPLARLGRVRGQLAARVRGLDAGGGTNIPSGLAMGLHEIESGSGQDDFGRVRRVVLVSDGLDSTREQAERLATDGAERGVTVSSMGIGLDFDEAYMSSIARDGHGNFGFVNDAGALATFLHRELDEASSTTVENATVRIDLPKGVRFVRASGADARVEGGGESVRVRLGSLFAGDERRALLELATDLDAGDARALGTEATWHRVGAGDADVRAPALALTATTDATEVSKGEDGAVLGSATSVLSSRRELEATEAYASGNVEKARQLIQENLQALAQAAARAPAPVAQRLAKQSSAYSSHAAAFAAPPSSDDGKRAAKAAAAKDSSNLAREAF
ncbi:MAG TPA: VWA domain-containing protein [Polyangiaceae bacterium]